MLDRADAKSEFGKPRLCLSFFAALRISLGTLMPVLRRDLCLQTE
jgi:hypothetical protein